jgi:hypothetical protein
MPCKLRRQALVGEPLDVLGFVAWNLCLNQREDSRANRLRQFDPGGHDSLQINVERCQVETPWERDELNIL